MLVYRFYLSFDNSDDFYFEVDILPTHTFYDFHKIIIDALKLSGTELASFYVSNNLWKKKTEITLIDMNIDDDVNLYDEEEYEGKKKKALLIMKDTKLIDIIQDPHQRFIYIYDFLSPWTLFIEMTKIVDADKNKSYPVLNKIVGELPTKKTQAGIITKAVENNEDELLSFEDFDEEDTDDDDNSDNVNPDDIIGEGFDDLKF